MEIKHPTQNGVTIYSKSGCQNCLKIKAILTKNKLLYTVIDCDEYLIENKELFKQNISKMINLENKSDAIFFPIIFNDAKYIGGYNEALIYIEKLFVSFENLTF